MWNKNGIPENKKYVLQLPSPSDGDMYWNDDLTPKRWQYDIFPEEGFLLTMERLLEIIENWRYTRYAEVEWVSDDTLRFKNFHWTDELR